MDASDPTPAQGQDSSGTDYSTEREALRLVRGQAGVLTDSAMRLQGVDDLDEAERSLRALADEARFLVEVLDALDADE